MGSYWREDWSSINEKRKWQWIGHTLRKNYGSVEKQAVDWNPQGVRRSERPKQTWKRTL
jgi:hypothetical protein